MHILKNVSLRLYSTMRLGGTASYLVNVKTKGEVRQAVAWAEARELPVIMVGGGSNIIWRDDGFHGLLIVNKIPGFKKLDEDDTSATIWVGAGRSWDKTVAESVAMDLSGIESLSLIPGTTGATPVQNVGAYGQEIAQTLVNVEAYDRFENEFVNLGRDQCAFGYRTSRFKTVDKDRFLITSITLRLLKKNPKPPFYDALQKYFDEHKTKDFTPASVRKAVIAIRSSKLPDPLKVPNNGSFFANPIVNGEHFRHLKAAYPKIASWEIDKDQYKISAAWLLEAAGFKGIHDKETGMAVWDKQALVFVNEKAQHTSDLLEFRQKILDKVKEQFMINLEQEPELLP